MVTLSDIDSFLNRYSMLPHIRFVLSRDLMSALLARRIQNRSCFYCIPDSILDMVYNTKWKLLSAPAVMVFNSNADSQAKAHLRAQIVLRQQHNTNQI